MHMQGAIDYRVQKQMQPVDLWVAYNFLFRHGRPSYIFCSMGLAECDLLYSVRHCYAILIHRKAVWSLRLNDQYGWIDPAK